MFRYSIQITLGKILGKTARLCLFVCILAHLVTVGLIFFEYEFIEVKWEETNNIWAVYNAMLFFNVTTITTVGYGQDAIVCTPSRLVTMVLEFAGIIFYGYAFQNMMHILDLARTYDQMIEAREDALDGWLIRREIKARSSKNKAVVEKARDAFEFLWSWDIQGVFYHEFFQKISPKLKDGVLTGPADFVIHKFENFFKAIENKDDMMKMVHSMKPNLYVNF